MGQEIFEWKRSHCGSRTDCQNADCLTTTKVSFLMGRDSQIPVHFSNEYLRRQTV
jgi:hypothetical protein